MADKPKLNFDEQNAIRTLTDKIIESTNQNPNRREEIFSRLSVFVEGVKFGLVSSKPAQII